MKYGKPKKVGRKPKVMASLFKGLKPDSKKKEGLNG